MFGFCCGTCLTNSTHVTCSKFLGYARSFAICASSSALSLYRVSRRERVILVMTNGDLEPMRLLWTRAASVAARIANSGLSSRPRTTSKQSSFDIAK